MIYRTYCLFRAVLAVLLGGCSIRPATIGPRVQGIHEAQLAQQSQAVEIRKATASSALTSAEIAKLKTLAGRSEGKASVILQWLDRQERKAHEKAP